MASKRKFREAKTAEDEKKKMVDDAVPRSTRSVTKWVVKIFREWHETSGNKRCLEEQVGFKVDMTKVDLGTDVADMSAESLNVWLTKFVEEVSKDNGSLHSICCDISRHVEDCNGSDAVKILNKNDQRLSNFRRDLGAQLRESSAEGIHRKMKKPEREGVSEEEEKILWAKNLLGCSTAQSLLHTFIFITENVFGIRAKEHRDLRPNPNKDIFNYKRMAVGSNTLNKIFPDKLCGAGGLTRKTSHNLRVACASRLFEEGVEEKLIRERTGHRPNALFKYEKISAKQETQVSKILGPPRGLRRNEKAEASPVVSEMDSLIPPDVKFEVRDDVLCNIPLPDDHIYVRETLTRSVFNNCTFNFVEK